MIIQMEEQVVYVEVLGEDNNFFSFKFCQLLKVGKNCGII